MVVNVCEVWGQAPVSQYKSVASKSVAFRG